MERIGTKAVAAAVDSLRFSLNSRGERRNEIAPIADADRLPELRSPEVTRVERFVQWTDSAGQLTLPPPLGDETRSRLTTRAHDLERAIAPCREEHRDRLLGAIAGMLGAFPTMQRHDRVAALGMAAAYLWTVRERPPWAIVNGCNLVRVGQAGLNRSFCPSEPEFSDIVKRLVAPYVDALRRVRLLLSAAVRPPDPPKLSREEIEAKLGRRIGAPPTDEHYMARALSDLEARKARRDPDLPPLPGTVPLLPDVPLSVPL
jgi:hypothetical protein